jgi:hypothetical protein
MTGTESAHANAGGFDLLRRATQAMMSRYVGQRFFYSARLFPISPFIAEHAFQRSPMPPLSFVLKWEHRSFLSLVLGSH